MSAFPCLKQEAVRKYKADMNAVRLGGHLETAQGDTDGHHFHLSTFGMILLSIMKREKGQIRKMLGVDGGRIVGKSRARVLLHYTVHHCIQNQLQAKRACSKVMLFT